MIGMFILLSFQLGTQTILLSSLLTYSLKLFHHIRYILNPRQTEVSLY